MTEPPVCTEDPWGGCQSGPLGNGSGGGFWCPWAPGGALNAYSSCIQELDGFYSHWWYDRLDGATPTSWDAEVIRQAYDFTSCEVFADEVGCY